MQETLLFKVKNHFSHRNDNLVCTYTYYLFHIKYIERNVSDTNKLNHLPHSNVLK